VEPFRPDYRQLVAGARDRLRIKYRGLPRMDVLCGAHFEIKTGTRFGSVHISGSVGGGTPLASGAWPGERLPRAPDL